MAFVGNNTEGRAQPSIREVQQEFAESLGYGMNILWDLLSRDQADMMQIKIKALIPDPKLPANLMGEELKQAENCVATKSRMYEIIRNKIFRRVWRQRKYTNRQSLTSIFYVLVATIEKDTELAKSAKTWSCHPVFRIRRCVSNNDGSSNNSSGCCMIYVDEHGRVYQNWSSYLSENELPEGIMVSPCEGIYQLDSNGNVLLESCVTPAGSTNRKVLGALDTTSAVAVIGAASVPLIGLFCTVITPIVLVASGVGLAAAVYTTARSGVQLADRKLHEQSINVTDRQARNHWISGIAGLLGLGAAGARSALTIATNAGQEVGAITQITVNSINISSIMVSGTGLANGTMDLVLKYQDGDDISTLDVLQLSTSLFLFTHSVSNFKLASEIINDTKKRKELMRNNQEFECGKISNNPGEEHKKDTIRKVNEIPSYESPSAEASTLVPNNNHNNGNTWEAMHLGNLVIQGVSIVLSKYKTSVCDRILNVESFRDTLLRLADNLTQETMRFVLTMLEEFIDTMWAEVYSFLGIYISSESVLYKLGRTILDEYRECSLQYIQKNAGKILESVKKYFMSLNPNSFPDRLTRCKICSGYYSICEL